MSYLPASWTGSRQRIDHLFRSRYSAANGGAPQLVICGFGRLGKALADASRASSTSGIWVIERNEAKADFARTSGLHVVCGDATDAHTQRVARIGSASEIAVCIDPPGCEEIVRVARALAPSAYIKVGISEPLRVAEIQAAGADYIIALSDLLGKLLARSVLPL